MARLSGAGRYATAEARWAGIGPYYAMFPPAFADEVVRRHSRPGDLVLDPFAGRGTSLFSAASSGRTALGIEISPVGFVYANAKLSPAPKDQVLESLNIVAERSGSFDRRSDALPEFYHYCYSPPVRRFLLAARSLLNWRTSVPDRTLMAIILVVLHGKRDYSLSNQMRQSTSMWPNYSVNWWRDRALAPPAVDPVAFLRRRIEWRYAKGRPLGSAGYAILGDSRTELSKLSDDVIAGRQGRARLLFTSPPYYNVTNYYSDQWLRLWMLGGPDLPSARVGGRYGNKAANRRTYLYLLDAVFRNCRPLLTDDATVYVRTDLRPVTYSVTLDVLKRMFADKIITQHDKPLEPSRQTKPYSRGGAPKRANCEVDIVLKPR
ncbi:MAG: site-specific DNA-methyltransferase [Acidobacteria bacterium]|nr:site-specific DNA-methyltransferase [Acidobacteriota bacterium]MYG27548.1 site-specific DNA-methyltransferase [Boseongicola sp. SB0677_bin_26]